MSEETERMKRIEIFATLIFAISLVNLWFVSGQGIVLGVFAVTMLAIGVVAMYRYLFNYYRRRSEVSA